MWYFWYTGSDGELYNLTHVFYATEQDHLNIATIQVVGDNVMTVLIFRACYAEFVFGRHKKWSGVLGVATVNLCENHGVQREYI